VPRTIESPMTPAEACSRIMALAEPEGPIEVSLVDALGLVLAEDAIADVDLPPFDRASTEGYAVRASEAKLGALLRVAGLRWSTRPFDDSLEAGEAIRVRVGDPLPEGADAVVRIEEVRADPEIGPTRVIEILRGPEPRREVARRGHLLEAGDVLAPAGTRLEPSMVGLLASQGCVHPVCHRRVRVAVVAVGDHLVGPTEAPVMHRERNAANASIVAFALRAGAMPHDLQAVTDSAFPAALERATSAPVIVVLGPSSRPIARAFQSFGLETIVSGVALKPGGRSRYAVIRDESGRVVHHVFHLPLAPMAASTAFALLVRPLIAGLQGGSLVAPRTTSAVMDGTHRAVGERLRAVPVSLDIGADARHRARPIPMRGLDDLAGFARADGLAMLPAGSGPWLGGEIVEVVRFD
jgi:molybdopterin molybdotransferase